TAHLSFIILILAPPPAARPPPFPYTTLFRSKSSLVKSQRTEEPSRRITVTAHALPSGSRDPRPHPRSHPGTDRRTRAGWGHREGDLRTGRSPRRELLQPVRVQGRSGADRHWGSDPGRGGAGRPGPGQ